MDITLDPELEQRLQYKVARGEYPSASAALNEALRRLLEPEAELADPLPLEDMRHEIMIGVEQLDRGDVVRFDAEAIKAEGRRILLSQQPNAKFLVTVLPEQDEEREEWLSLSAQRLAEAYGDDEPEYPISCIREMNNVDLAAAYQQMAEDETREMEAREWVEEAQDRAEAVEGIRRGLEACEQGRMRPFREFAAEQRAKFNRADASKMLNTYPVVVIRHCSCACSLLRVAQAKRTRKM